MKCPVEDCGNELVEADEDISPMDIVWPGGDYSSHARIYFCGFHEGHMWIFAEPLRPGVNAHPELN